MTLPPSSPPRSVRSAPRLRMAGAALVFGLAALVFALAVAATLKLKHVGEHGVEAERDLQAVVTAEGGKLVVLHPPAHSGW